MSTDSGGDADAVPMSVVASDVCFTVNQGTVPAAGDARNSWLAVEIGSTPKSVDLYLGQDVVDVDVDSIDVVFIVAG